MAAAALLLVVSLSAQLAQLGVASVATEERLWPSFQALPKNSYGRLDAPAGALALQRHFSREHGLRLLPGAAAEALRATERGRGASLLDLAAAAAALEASLLQPKELLAAAYARQVAGLASEGAALERKAAAEVLADYLRELPVEQDTVEPSKMLAALGSKDSFTLEDAVAAAKAAVDALRVFSPCDRRLREVEEQVQAPAASPERLVRIAAASKASPGLLEALRAIADRHGGSVPLHGDSLSEALRLAFPAECGVASRSDVASAPEPWAAMGMPLVRLTISAVVVLAMLRSIVAQLRSAHRAASCPGGGEKAEKEGGDAKKES